MGRKTLKTFTVWVQVTPTGKPPTWALIRKMDEYSPRKSEIYARRWELGGYKTKIETERIGKNGKSKNGTGLL